jgi:hypothetical protein
MNMSVRDYAPMDLASGSGRGTPGRRTRSTFSATQTDLAVWGEAAPARDAANGSRPGAGGPLQDVSQILLSG